MTVQRLRRGFPRLTRSEQLLPVMFDCNFFQIIGTFYTIIIGCLNVVRTFKFLNEILMCDHANESYGAIVIRDAVYNYTQELVMKLFESG